MDEAGEVKGQSLYPKGRFNLCRFWDLGWYGLKDRGVKGGDIVASIFRNHIQQPAVKASGLEELKVKDMRKTAATNLLQSGLDMKTVTAVLDHENISTTLNHYAMTTPESLINADNDAMSAS